MSVRRMLELAGGSAGETSLKAVLVGGPAGGFLPDGQARHAVHADGAWRGRVRSGARAPSSPSDQGTCLVDMATTLVRYLSDESCGKTIPCRIGVRRLYEIGRASNDRA